ncbi:MAG TPA: MtrB/PioB family outer membrane beta-barrel protein [Vicinamibacterales bacterium]|nr:MtrB/PioB family outer membrane beta-barrel protein [Vicinamibacterales bacterium]
MRNTLITLAALLASAHVALAQTPPTKPAPADVPSNGLADVGVRFGSDDGDEARFERYRDLRPGAATLFEWTKHTDSYRFNAGASNVGYRDQRYSADYYTGKLAVSGVFDSIPLNYFYDANSFWTTDGNGRFTLPLDVRQGIQGPTNSTTDGTAVGVPCAPGGPPAACSATTAAAAITNRSIYANTGLFPQTQDIQVRRDILGGTVRYTTSPAFSFKLDASTTSRTGNMPWAASYAFNNANELVIPIDQRNNELKAGSEWVSNKGMLRLDYWGSYFTNDIQTLTWDNPIRATDFNNGLVPPNGPYDPSGYSNGNGPALGQAALWPSNNLNSIGTTGMFKFTPRTTVNGNLTYTFMRQDESLLPWTLNSSINNPTVLAAFPGLRQLPRSSAEAAVNSTNWLLNFSSRELRFVTIQARYRYNDHENNTPHFDGREYVRFDAVPEEFVDDPNTPYLEGFSEYFQITRKNLDLNGTFGLKAFGSIRVGYANEEYEREGRGFSDVSENTFRAAYDARLFNYIGVRASLDTGQRRGDGFILSGIDYEEGPAGTQPGLRYYDEADRDRTKAMLVLSANPHDQVGVFFQFTTTRDTFLGDESIPAGREQFGLLSNDINAWAAGADYSLNDMVHFGLTYGWDKFNAVQKSRNANPPPDPTWTDPERNWFLDNTEKVNTVTAYVDMLGLMQSKADLRVGYEMNDSDNNFDYYGPRIDSLTAAGQFIPLPNVVNDWRRFTVDLKYFVSAAVGIGVGYWYENFDVTDWNTLDFDSGNFTGGGPVGFYPSTGTPRIDWLGGLMTGYGNRPYSGGRFFVRMLYRF